MLEWGSIMLVRQHDLNMHEHCRSVKVAVQQTVCLQ